MKYAQRHWQDVTQDRTFCHWPASSALVMVETWTFTVLRHRQASGRPGSSSFARRVYHVASEINRANNRREQAAARLRPGRIRPCAGHLRRVPAPLAGAPSCMSRRPAAGPPVTRSGRLARPTWANTAACPVGTLLVSWSGWPDSNRRPPRPKRGALAKLRYSPYLGECSGSHGMFAVRTRGHPCDRFGLGPGSPGRNDVSAEQPAYVLVGELIGAEMNIKRRRPA